MKKLICILVLCVFVGMAIGGMTGTPRSLYENALGTNQYSFDIARTVTTNDVALTTTTRDWGAIGGVFHALPSRWSNVFIQFYAYGDGTGAGSPNNGTFDFTIFVARRFGGAIQVCTQNDAAIGAVQLSHNPFTSEALSDGNEDLNYCWADTFAVTGDWPTAIAEAGNLGADNIGSLSFDGLGTGGIYIIINDMTSITSLTYVISGIGG